MTRIMFGCEKTRVRLDDWLDHALDSDAAAEVNDHLAFCEDCRALYRRNVELRDDLAALGAAADRWVDEASPSVRPPGRAAMTWKWGWPGASRVAAAVMLVVAAGYLLMPSRPAGVHRIAERDAPPSDVLVEITQFIGDVPVTLGGEDRVRVLGAPDCVAVNVKTDDPRIHVVWLHGSCASETPPRGGAFGRSPNG